MRESIRVEQIRCERCIAKLGQALAPIKGLNEARVEMGTSSVVVDYDDAMGPQIDEAIQSAGFKILDRQEIAGLVS
jgi:copper chaperone CopZ